jgi:hypothetical protein
MSKTLNKVNLPIWMYGVLGGVSSVLATWLERTMHWPEIFTFITVGGLVFLGSLSLGWAYARWRKQSA